jgi:hypothetical protein
MDYSLENYELEYSIFLAENELFNNFMNLGNSIVNESFDSGLITLQENVKDTIMNYLKKIITAVQNIWNKIKEIFNNTKDNVYLKSIEKAINDSKKDPEFTIDNYKIYNDSKFDMIKIIPFNYEQMKDSLDSVNHFLQVNYSNITDIGKDETKVKDAVLNYVCISNNNGYRLKNDDIKKIFSWCINDYKKNITNIENDIKSLNSSSSNIENIVNNTMSATSEAVEYYNYYITEADNDDNDKMKINDDKPEDDTNDQNNNKGSDNNNQVVKDIQTYMSATTQILTAKINIMKDRRKDYISILKHYIPAKDIVKKDNNINNNSQSNNNTSTSYKVVL